jgi:hypothetical protein
MTAHASLEIKFMVISV